MKVKNAGWIRKATLPGLLLAALSLALLQQVGRSAEGNDQHLSPFRQSATIGEGLILEISGTRTTFSKGSSYEFELSLSNPVGRPWVEEICVLLLGPSSRVESVLMHNIFNLDARTPLAIWQVRLTGQWPQNLDEGTYQLAVVIPEVFTTFRPIRIENVDGPNRISNSDFTVLTPGENSQNTAPIGRQIPQASWEQIQTCLR